MTDIQKSIIVCAVQRSGSSLLCEALKNTGLAGVPEEYFLCDENGPVWETGWWAKQHGVTNRHEHIELVKEKGTTSNGVFATKLMWNYFQIVIDGLRKLPEYSHLPSFQLLSTIFPNFHFVWIVRQDKAKQAVSWSIAAQTGHYGQPDPPPQTSTQYDFEQIDNLHQLILEGEAGWHQFFSAQNVTPHQVTYESLIESYEETAKNILKFADIDYPTTLTFGKRELKKQGTSINQAWANLYRQHKQEQDL
ncbi:MAG: Stf0 family sulfotransferase [Chloroflexota bacterium]